MEMAPVAMGRFMNLDTEIDAATSVMDAATSEGNGPPGWWGQGMEGARGMLADPEHWTEEPGDWAGTDDEEYVVQSEGRWVYVRAPLVRGMVDSPDEYNIGNS